MEYRQLGGSGFKVPVLSLGTGTFGGGGELFKAWGASDVAEATRLVDICLDAGLTMFDFQRLHRSQDIDSAPLMAASIFLDILNVFLFFLRIFSRND